MLSATTKLSLTILMFTSGVVIGRASFNATQGPFGHYLEPPALPGATVAHIFTPNTKALAEEVNRNFEDVKAGIMSNTEAINNYLSTEVVARLNEQVDLLNSFPGGSIAEGTITSLQLGADSVNSDDIADGTVMTDDLAPNSVDGTKILDGSVSLADIAANSVDAVRIVDKSVGTSELADGAVDRPQIKDGAIDTTKVQNGSITADDMAVNSVGSMQIVDRQVSSVDLGPGSVGAFQLQTGAVSLANLGPDSVDGTKIVNASVALADLAPNSVDGAKVLDGSIGSSDIAPNSIDAARILDGSVADVDVSPGVLAGIAASEAATATGSLITLVASPNVITLVESQLMPPSNGWPQRFYVLALASFVVHGYVSTSSDHVAAYFGHALDDNPSAVPSRQFFMDRDLGGPSGTSGDPLLVPCTIHDVIEVVGSPNAIHSIKLKARIDNAGARNAVYINQVYLTLLYIPKSYGSVAFSATGDGSFGIAEASVDAEADSGYEVWPEGGVAADQNQVWFDHDGGLQQLLEELSVLRKRVDWLEDLQGGGNR